MTKRQTPSSSSEISPWVTSALLAGRNTQLADVRTNADTIYWLETRAAGGGNTTLVAQKGAAPPCDVTRPEVNVRSAVNEYGGGAYAIAEDGSIIFSNSEDHRVYRIADGVQKVVGGSENCRYADFFPVTHSDRTKAAAFKGVFCIREDHRGEGQATTSLIWLTERDEIVLAAGQDFYAAPRLSPDWHHLAFISWDHPNMPWDVTQLSMLKFGWTTEGPVTQDVEILVGPEAQCSVMAPLWQDQAHLLALSDAKGAWRPIQFNENDAWSGQFLPDPGFEIGSPPWVFGQQSIVNLCHGHLLAHGFKDGKPHVARFDGEAWQEAHFGLCAAVPLPIGDEFAWIHTPTDAPPCIRKGQQLAESRVLRQAFAFPTGIGTGDCARPQFLEFPTRDGATAYGFFYAPVQSDILADQEGRPPLVVMAHGGPTAGANPAFSFKVQWWTTRGFAVLDVNYRGSTGWGRGYRQALDGAWGERDVLDCIDAVRHICAQGLVNPARCVIRGASAGGLTVLQGLALSDVFCAGTSLYGVADLMTLVAETHKFESRYLDRLVGPLPIARDLYSSRSPVNHAERIKAPVLFLHGDADRVVPLTQAEEMHRRLKKNGVTSFLKIYSGEGHGFRVAQTLSDCFQREYAFYLDVFRGSVSPR